MLLVTLKFTKFFLLESKLTGKTTFTSSYKPTLWKVGRKIGLYQKLN